MSLRRYCKSFEFMHFVAYVLLFFCLASCNKKLSSGDNSESSVQYFNAGIHDRVRSVEKTGDGGFIYCGYNILDSNNIQAFLLKVDAFGNKQWYKTYGGSYYDEFWHVIQCSDGGYLAVGRTNSMGKGFTDSNFIKLDYVLKTNSDGTEQWSNSYSPASTGMALLSHVVESSDHFFYITGYAYGSSSTWYNVLLMKLDFTGKRIYQKQLSSFNAYPPKIIQQNWFETGTNISLNNNGDLMISGVMDHSNVGAYIGEYITFLISARPDGFVNFFYPYYNYQRELNYVADFNDERYHNTKVINLDDGYVLVTFFDLPGNKLCIEVLRTDLNGVVLWEKKYSGLGNAIMDDAQLLNDGKISILGSTSDVALNFSLPELFSSLKPWLLTLDKNGTIISSKIIGSNSGASLAKCIRLLPDGNSIIAGYTCPANTAFDKMFLMKVNSDGQLTDNK
jgi:hypothetical protein